jgi:putative Mg2+ transporter-C (MgtC) family protein
VTLDPNIIVIRLGLALAFGTVIGVEREWRQKHAGLKTMALVSLGAAAFGMLSDTFGPGNHNPAQIAAAVVGGIGFIGAGVIMHRGTTVQGVTTAATLWADASVGLSIGLGHYALGTILAGAIVILQFAGRTLEIRLFRAKRPHLAGRFELRISCDPETLHVVNAASSGFGGISVVRRVVQREPEHVVLRVIFRATETIDLTPLEEQLIALNGTHRVEVRHLGLEED